MQLQAEANDPGNPRPYGAQQIRTLGPLLLWSVLYAAWIVFLVALVAYDRLK